MGFKTFTATTLTAADVNDYLMEQAVISCTAATRPTPAEGMTIWETDTDRIMYYNGTGWVILDEPRVTWTPTWGNLSGGTSSGWYKRSSGWCDFKANYVLAGAGVAGSVTLTLPFTSDDADGGVFNVKLTETGSGIYTGAIGASSTTVLTLSAPRGDVTYLLHANLSSTVPFVWANTDVITVTGRYLLDNQHSF
jgi:hypothetical protein